MKKAKINIGNLKVATESIADSSFHRDNENVKCKERFLLHGFGKQYVQAEMVKACLE